MSSVDVIVPCYNYARFLRECVTSALSQADVQVRVLIIDDCSTDDTPTVAAQIAAADSRVEYRRHSVNRGHIATYNEGLEWAAQDYCVLISADDLLLPGALSRGTRLLDLHPEAGMAYGRVLRQDSDAPAADLPQPSADASFEIVRGVAWIERVCRAGMNHIASPEVIVRTSMQKSVGLYSPALTHAGDLEMWLRFAARSAVIILEHAQAVYRIHSRNMHLQFAQRHLRDLEQCWLAFHGVLSRYLSGPEGARLELTVRQKLAIRAIHGARVTFGAGAVDESGLLLDYAARVFPRARRWWSFKRVECMLFLGLQRWTLARRCFRAITTLAIGNRARHVR